MDSGVIGQFELYLLQALAGVLLAVLIAVARILFKKLNVDLSASQRAALDEVAQKSMDAAVSTLTGEIKAKGWDHPDIKSAALNTAIAYAAQNFPGALKKEGIDPTNPEQLATKLQGIMERVFVPSTTAAAKSPATPPAPTDAITVTTKDATP